MVGPVVAQWWGIVAVAVWCVMLGCCAKDTSVIHFET